ncbi:MAG: FG-GAP-like repeat-containing protein [Candidatus Bipolaricaulia bacterium]
MHRVALRAVLLSALALLLAGAVLGAGTGIPVGDHPRSVAVGDFDRNGWDDFAVTNELSNDITICIAKGDGSFDCKADAVKYDAYKPVIPMAIAVADLTKDGIEDLALAACGLTEIVTTTVTATAVSTRADYANFFTFKGDGRGGFTKDKALRLGDCPSAVVIADFDRDGALEIVVANSGSNDLTIIDDTRTTNFSAGGITPVALAFGDFNRDAKPDLVVANSGSNNLCVLLGKGDGAFEAPICFETGRRPQDVKVADLDCDNIQDLVVANFESDDVWTFLGDGTGKKFTLKGKYRVDQAPSALVVRDLNQDAMVDIAVANALANDIWILSGRRDAQGKKGEFQAVAGKFAVGEKPVAIASGDFDKDRDGNPDLVVANELSNDVTILLGKGAAGFFLPELVKPNQPPIADFSWTPLQPKAGETVKFDGSASRDPDGQITAYVWDFGDGKSGSGKTAEHAYAKEGTYKVCLTVRDDKGAEGKACKDLTVLAAPPPPPPASKAPTVGIEPAALVGGDFNGDGKEDLAVANQDSNSISILLGAGDGKFSPSGTVSVGISPSDIVATDFNKDNQLDLAVTNAGSNNLTILLGDGKGGFQPRGGPAVGSNPMALVANDLDKDGNIDLIVANSGSNNLAILLGNGDGSFKEAITIAAAGEAPESLALGDLNNDGKADLAVSNLNSNDIAILLGNGTGGFTPGPKLTGLNRPRRLTIKDFNGDGKPDLAVAESEANAVTVFCGRGNGSLSLCGKASTGESPRALVAEDFNNDKKLDLAVANYSSNNLSILLGKGDGSFEEQRLVNVGEKPNAVIAGRFNPDENVDLAVANAGSNNATVLLGKGDGTFEDPPLASLETAWSGALVVGGLGSLVLFPLLLWLFWSLRAGVRRVELWSGPRLGLRR